MTKSYQETIFNVECLICHNTYKYLGSHIWHKHKLKAKEYKARFYLDYNLPLMDLETMEKKRKAFEENREKYLKNLSRKTQFKKGKRYRNYFSKQSINRFLEQLDVINKGSEAEVCPVCNMKYENLSSHLYNKHKMIRVKE